MREENGQGGGGSAGSCVYRRILVTILLLLMLSGRVFADWGYEEIDYTMAILNTSYPGSLDRPAELGKFSEGHVGPASGILVHVQSVNATSDHACTLPLRAVSGGESIPLHEPWIALIRRGQCSYEQKVENAFKSNATGIIIFNDRESPVLQKMRVSTHRDISAVFTYLWKGEALTQKIDNGTRVMMSISVGSFCSRPYSSLNRTSVLFVSISFIVLMVISLTWLVFYYIQRFRYFHAKDRLARRLCSAAKKALSKIPTKNIRSEDKELQGEGECCAICIEPYKISDVLRILPCRHEFHKPCIDPWLLEHRTCPMCKMDILKFYGYSFAGSQESILQIDMEEGLADSESVSTSPSPEPPEYHQQHRPSVGTITVSASTPYGQIDPQVGVFNELLAHPHVSQTAAYDSVYAAAASCPTDTKPEKPTRGKKHQAAENEQIKNNELKNNDVDVETISLADSCKDDAPTSSEPASAELTPVQCACTCACTNTLVVAPAPEPTPAAPTSLPPPQTTPLHSPTNHRRKRCNSEELS